MIIDPDLPGGSIIFCDDVRTEITGKSFFIGVYGPELHIASEDVSVLPPLCAIILYRENPKSLPASLAFVAFLKGSPDVELARIELPITQDLIAEGQAAPETTDETVYVADIRMVLRIPPFAVEEDSVLAIRALRDDDMIRLGALQIKVSKLERAT